MSPTARKKDSEAVKALASVPIFASCTGREIKAIAAGGKVVEFSAGDVICRQGKVGLGLHVVLEGETKVKIDDRTRRRLGAGAFFGEIALLDGGPRTATVVAETDVRTWVLPRWSFKSVLEGHPALARKILEEVCARLRSVDSALSD